MAIDSEDVEVDDVAKTKSKVFEIENFALNKRLQAMRVAKGNMIQRITMMQTNERYVLATVFKNAKTQQPVSFVAATAEKSNPESVKYFNKVAALFLQNSSQE